MDRQAVFCEYDAFNDKGDALARDLWMRHKLHEGTIRPRPGEGVSVRPTETILWIADMSGIVQRWAGASDGLV